MATYQIVLDDEGRTLGAWAPWTATLFEELEDGRTSDSIAVGIGGSPGEALDDMMSVVSLEGWQP